MNKQCASIVYPMHSDSACARGKAALTSTGVVRIYLYEGGLLLGDSIRNRITRVTNQPESWPDVVGDWLVDEAESVANHFACSNNHLASRSHQEYSISEESAVVEGCNQNYRLQ